MGKTFDKVGITLISLLLAFLFYFHYTHSLVIALFSALLSIAICVMAVRLIRPREPKHLLSKKNFVRYILLNGNNVLKTLAELSFSERFSLEDAEGHTVIDTNDRILIYYCYKFGSLSEEDVAKSYRLAQKYRCTAIYALTNHLDRRAYAVTEYIPQKFTVINTATLYKYLLKKNLIPERECLARKSGKVGKIIKTALAEGNAKYYIWAGLSTSFLALFTPITTYYIVFAFINLALAIGCLFFSEKGEGKDRLFKE